MLSINEERKFNYFPEGEDPSRERDAVDVIIFSFSFSDIKQSAFKFYVYERHSKVRQN